MKNLIYFSPTSNSKIVGLSIAEGLDYQETFEINLTFPETKYEKILNKNSLNIISSPVYAGRIPAAFKSRLSEINGNGSYAILAVTYGNREFDDALIELYDFTIQQNFVPIALCAFIGEHSYSNDDYPIAQGRPDKKDLNEAKLFGRSIINKLETTININKIIKSELVPGKRPYLEMPAFLNCSTKLENEKCTGCKECISACPVQAIHYKQKIIIDQSRCIRCCACIRKCKSNVLRLNDERIEAIRERLSKIIVRKKNLLLV